MRPLINPWLEHNAHPKYDFIDTLRTNKVTYLGGCSLVSFLILLLSPIPRRLPMQLNAKIKHSASKVPKCRRKMLHKKGAYWTYAFRKRENITWEHLIVIKIMGVLEYTIRGNMFIAPDIGTNIIIKCMPYVYLILYMIYHLTMVNSYVFLSQFVI